MGVMQRFYDRQKINHIKKGLLLALEKLVKNREGAGLEIGDFLDKSKAEDAGLAGMAIEEIRQSHPEYSIVQWASGPALVRTVDLDNMPDEFLGKNKRAGMIVLGGE